MRCCDPRGRGSLGIVKVSRVAGCGTKADAQADALNLLNAHTNQITYAYGSLLRSDPLYAQCKSAIPPPIAVCQTGVTDSVLHPVEPLAARLTLAGVF